MRGRERTYRTEAIVLRRKDIGEADRILTLFTPQLGKVRVVAKGIRKPRSRKAGHLELFTRAKLLLATGRDLDIITQAEGLDAYPRDRRESARIRRWPLPRDRLVRYGAQTRPQGTTRR